MLCREKGSPESGGGGTQAISGEIRLARFGGQVASSPPVSPPGRVVAALYPLVGVVVGGTREGRLPLQMVGVDGAFSGIGGLKHPDSFV